MDNSQTILKVKDTSFVRTLIIAFCVFPIIFFLIASGLQDNYILAILITVLIYSVLGILFFRRLKRDEEVYALTATTNSISFRTRGTFNWADISDIETFCEIPFGRRSPHRYIKFVLFQGDDIILDASNYDIDYEDLKRRLLVLKTKAATNKNA